MIELLCIVFEPQCELVTAVYTKIDILAYFHVFVD